MTDYRIELDLALKRALAMVSAKSQGKDLIMVGTPLDNFVYATINLSEMVNAGVPEKESFTYWLTTHLLYALITDSLDMDLLFYLPLKEDEEDDSYLRAVDEMYPAVLEELAVTNYVVLDGSDEQDIAICATMVERLQEAQRNENRKREDGVRDSSAEDPRG